MGLLELEAPPCESRLCLSLPSSMLCDVLSEAWMWPWCEYLHYWGSKWPRSGLSFSFPNSSVYTVLIMKVRWGEVQRYSRVLSTTGLDYHMTFQSTFGSGWLRVAAIAWYHWFSKCLLRALPIPDVHEGIWQRSGYRKWDIRRNRLRD